MHALAGFGSAVGAEQEDFFAAGTRRTDHTFGDTKTHLSGFEIGDTQYQSPDEVFLRENCHELLSALRKTWKSFELPGPGAGSQSPGTCLIASSGKPTWPGGTYMVIASPFRSTSTATGGPVASDWEASNRSVLVKIASPP